MSVANWDRKLHHNQIGPVGTGEAKSFLAVVGLHYSVAVMFKDGTIHKATVLVPIDEQNRTCVHGSLPVGVGRSPGAVPLEGVAPAREGGR
jgi:hypothetical protein